MLRFFYVLLISSFLFIILFFFGFEGLDLNNSTDKSAFLYSKNEKVVEGAYDFSSELEVKLDAEGGNFIDTIDNGLEVDVKAGNHLDVLIEKEIEYVSLNLFYYNACLGVANFDDVNYYLASIDYSSLHVDHDFYSSLFFTCKEKSFYSEDWLFNKYEELYNIHGVGYDYIISKILPVGHPKATKWIILSSVWNDENENKLLRLDDSVYLTYNQRFFFEVLKSLGEDSYNFYLVDEPQHSYFLKLAKAYKYAGFEEKRAIAAVVADDFLDKEALNGIVGEF